jgi:hypothetical protein
VFGKKTKLIAKKHLPILKKERFGDIATFL